MKETKDFARLKAGELRIVSNQRKRKLRKKGRLVWWSGDLAAWVWTPRA